MIKPVEFIKPIKNFSGYFISNEGNVYCNLGKGNRRTGNIVEMYQIKPRYTKSGYTRVYMREDSSNKRKDKYIHRLVAEAFIDNPENKEIVNHINCKRNKNMVENLEWVSAKENIDYSIKLNHLVRDSNGKFRSNFNYNSFK